MSLWQIGSDDVSEEAQAIKNQAFSKVAECADLRTLLMKRTQEIEELKLTLNDTLHKLSNEAERALRLERDFAMSSEDLKNEKLASQNVQASLAAANQKLKEQDVATKELQTVIDTISHRSDESRSYTAKLEREKSVAEARVRELEVNLRQVNSTTSQQISTPRSHHRGMRPRSSSSVLPGIQHELNDARALLAKKEVELRSAQDKVARAQSELNQLANEKAAMEKKTQAELHQLQASLEERQEEIEYLRAQQAEGGRLGAGEREQDLLCRIEEDDAKMELMLKDVDAMRAEQKRVERQLQVERRKAADAEARQIQLVSDREEALDKLEDAETRIQQLSQVIRDDETRIEALTDNARELREQLAAAQDHADGLETEVQQLMAKDLHMASATPTFSPTKSFEPSGRLEEPPIAYVERLLNAIDRLRGERDGLRADLAFSEAESKFALEAMEAKLGSAAASGEEVDKLQVLLACQSEAMRQKDEEIRRLTLAATASMIAVQHLDSQADCDMASDSARLASLKARLEDAVAACVSKDQAIAELSEKSTDLEMRCNVISLDLEAAAAQRTKLYAQIKRLEGKDVESAVEVRRAKEAQKTAQAELDHANAQLSKANQSLEEVEAQRNALDLQVVNLQSDLEKVQEELAEAQDNYTTLQARQLSSLSTSEVTRALREQIKELEMRVLRRTEQIGMLQHDIKRLEMNLKLQEERLCEMTTELEMSAAEKAAMVEDCADARDARDDALQKVDWLEVEVEVREDQLADVAEQLAEREIELVTLVELMVGSMSKARNAANLVLQHSHAEEELSRKLQQTEESLASAHLELDRASVNHQQASHLLNEKAVMLEAVSTRANELEKEARQAMLALAVSQLALQRSRDANTELKLQADGLKSELDSRDRHHSRASAEAEAQLVMRTSELTARLEQLQQENNTIALNHQSAVRELQDRLTESKLSLSHHVDMTRLQSQRDGEELRSLEEKLGHAVSQLKDALQACADAEARYQDVKAERIELEVRQCETAQELTRAKEDLDARLAELTARSVLVQQLQESASDQLQRINILEAQLHESSRALYDLEVQARGDADRHIREEERARGELQSVTERCQHAESAQAESQAQINAYREEVASLQSEKEAIQMEMTTLEAGIQRGLSLQRYMESQAKDSELKIASLTDALEKTRANLAKVDTAHNMAQVKAAFQKSEQEKISTSLRRELAALQAKPNLEPVVEELEAKCREMEQVLRSKCEEVEENDDRFIEMLKERKKLASKIESLSRKVLSLQKKLADAKNPTAPLTTTTQTVARPASPVTVSPVQVSSAPSSQLPPFPPRNPVYVTHGPQHPIPESTHSHVQPSTQPSRTRANSNPFSLPRPKTPEKHVAHPITKQRSPERYSAPATLTDAPLTPSSGVVAGRKRPPPEEFESLPTQGFTPDSIPVYPAPTEVSTPRGRKALQGHSGFTPVRNSSTRPTVPLASPRRRVALPREKLISDVTNNPRQSADVEIKPVKRSWLGKIRSIPPQAPMRTLSGFDTANHIS